MYASGIQLRQAASRPGNHHARTMTSNQVRAPVLRLASFSWAGTCKQIEWLAHPGAALGTASNGGAATASHWALMGPARAYGCYGPARVFYVPRWGKRKKGYGFLSCHCHIPVQWPSRARDACAKTPVSRRDFPANPYSLDRSFSSMAWVDLGRNNWRPLP